MDVTNLPSASREESDHPVQERSSLVSAGVEHTYDETSVTVADVTFRPGERTKFHAYAGVQIIYITEGVGMIGNRDENRVVSEGDLVVFEPGEEHWYGTVKNANTEFSHVYFLAEPDGGVLAIQEAPYEAER